MSKLLIDLQPIINLTGTYGILWEEVSMMSVEDLLDIVKLLITGSTVYWIDVPQAYLVEQVLLKYQPYGLPEYIVHDYITDLESVVFNQIQGATHVNVSNGACRNRLLIYTAT